MKIAYTDLWTSAADIHVVTTCGVIKSGELVMGKGAALELKRRCSEFPVLIRRWCYDAHIPFPVHKDLFVYEFHAYTTPPFGAFQTRLNYRDKADLALIGYSVVIMRRWIQIYPDYTIAMNYPGIGLGGLDRKQVEPLVELLPDNVTLHIRRPK